jgi:signal transduction histidine kinase
MSRPSSSVPEARSVMRFSPRSLLFAAAVFVMVSFAGIGAWLLTHFDVSQPFMPHGHCYLWKPGLVWLHVSSDFCIGAAYVAISSTLAYLVARARREIPFHWMMMAFAVFIVACGATHLMEVWTVWTPRYWLAGAVKLVTAVASVSVAIVLPPLVPKVLALLEAARVSTQRKIELEAANAQLATLYERVKQLDELKTNFFTNVSHEFRTPLTLILGPVDRLLALPELRETERHDLDTIRRHALVLHKHVNDLLDVSKLEAGKMTLAYGNVDLAVLVRVSFAYFDTVARERLATMFVNAPDSLAAQVDSEKIERVLINLFSNAMKFVPEGGQVRCTLSAPGDKAIIEVEDNGPGIPPEMRAAVFERFQQVESGAARRVGGTGLGLAIVKEFVELHGGAIRVGDSSLGGANFHIELPLRAPADATLVPQTGPGATDRVSVSESHLEMLRQEVQKARTLKSGRRPAQFEANGGAPEKADKRPRVLIVEDTPEMNDFLARIFSADFRVLSALNGAEGLQKARELLPDLIISDVMMPEMDGEQLLNNLRNNEQTSAIPVILLTAKASDSLRMSLLRAGAQDYVIKPFLADELLTRARNLVTAKLARDTLQHELASHTHDIAQLATEITARTRELQAAKESAEAANRAKDQFLAVLSHELRTPLAPVLTAVSYLQSGNKLPTEAQEILAIVQRNVELEARLIDDLLDLTRISKGKLQLSLDTVNAHDLLEHAIKICESEFLTKRLIISTKLRAANPFIHADSARVLQVFLNLLQNAIKFTPENGRVVVRTTQPDEKTLHLEVADNGIGIETAILPKIFDAFEQGDSAVTRRFGGLGLGLAVSRALVEAHGGKISAFSLGRDQGTSVAVELPSAKPLSHPPESGEKKIGHEPSASAKVLRVLLVEDHEDTRAALRHLLARWGYIVETADSVRGALEKFDSAKVPFDLLVSDLGLPDGRGTELMRELRKRADIPGIAVSGFGMEHDIEESKAAGFSEHITKPVSAQKLKSVIQALTGVA